MCAGSLHSPFEEPNRPTSGAIYSAVLVGSTLSPSPLPSPSSFPFPSGIQWCLSSYEKFALVSLQHQLFSILVKLLLAERPSFGEDLRPPFQELGFAAAGLLRNLASASTSVQRQILQDDETLRAIRDVGHHHHEVLSGVVLISLADDRICAGLLRRFERCIRGGSINGEVEASWS